MRKGNVIWLSGLPCSGKTTIAKELKRYIDCFILDGDVVRKTISSDLGFSIGDRKQHLIRMAHLARFLSDNGKDVVCAFVSPTEEIRKVIRDIVGSKIIEVYVEATKESCIERDVKGMWKMAMEGKIKEFTGVSSPFEPPIVSDVVCDTNKEGPKQSALKITRFINDNRGTALYIGRWQPLHEGHRYLIGISLDKGIPVTIGVRDMLPDNNNPFTAETVAKNIMEVYKDEDVEVVIIPNIKSINYGRGVGYEIIQHTVPENIEEISATKIRATLKNTREEVL